MKLFAAIATSFVLSAPALALDITSQASLQPSRTGIESQATDPITEQCTYEFNQYVGDVYVGTMQVFKHVDSNSTSVFLNNLTYRDDTVCPQTYHRTGGYVSVTVHTADGQDGLTTKNISWNGYPTTLNSYISGLQIPSCGTASIKATTVCDYP